MIFESGNSAAVVCYEAHGGVLICTDIRNYIDKSPYAIAKMVGCNWPTDPDDDVSENDAILISCERCEILMEVVKNFIAWHKNGDFGRLGLTTAATSMAIFRHAGMMHDIELPEYQEERDLQRAAYHGGRTEALWIGGREPGIYRPHPLSQYKPPLIHEAPIGPYHLIDASSFYGSIYESCDLPCEVHYRGERMTESEAKRLITDDRWLATVRIESHTEKFPVKTEFGTKYAIGNYVTTLCGPELLRAVQTNCVKDVGEWQLFTMQPILRRFASLMYAERKWANETGNKIVESWCKQLIAQLHGKFAQRNANWVVCNDVIADKAWGRWQHYSAVEQKIVQYRSVGWEVQRETEGGDAAICFPAIAAFVAACGREKLRLWELQAGKRNTLYLSTDSLIVTDAGHTNLQRAGELRDNEMGYLRVLCTSPTIEIRGIGTLTIGPIIVTQGIKHATDEKIFGTISEEISTGLEYAINNNGTPIVRMTKRDVTPAWHYDPARVDDDGWVSPAHLNCGELQWEQYRKSSATKER